jgi:2Fe-2S ferredoxin
MITVNFIDHTGQTRQVAAEPGSSLMQAAVDNGIRGIVAECGGACSCATCVCQVDAAWAGRVGPAEGMEQAMLDGALDDASGSRLSCQIRLTPALHGLVVRVPQSQY